MKRAIQIRMNDGWRRLNKGDVEYFHWAFFGDSNKKLLGKAKQLLDFSLGRGLSIRFCEVGRVQQHLTVIS